MKCIGKEKSKSSQCKEFLENFIFTNLFLLLFALIIKTSFSNSMLCQWWYWRGTQHKERRSKLPLHWKMGISCDLVVGIQYQQPNSSYLFPFSISSIVPGLLLPATSGSHTSFTCTFASATYILHFRYRPPARSINVLTSLTFHHSAFCSATFIIFSHFDLNFLMK